MIILFDTREQKNGHILKGFERLGVGYAHEKLDYGDYSCICDGIDYRNKIVIERKNSITEICGNFAKGKSRFQREFERARTEGCKLYLMIEDDWENIDSGKYRSRFSPRDIKARLNTWCHSYMITLDFVNKGAAADHIVKTFRNYIEGRNSRE